MAKRDVKPFVPIELKEVIYKLSFVTGYSVKAICEDLCKKAFNNDFGKELAPYFERPLKVDGVLYPGQENPKRFKKSKGKIERLSLKIDSKMYEYAYSLSYAIGCSVAKVIAYAIEKSMYDSVFMDNYIKQYLKEMLNDNQKNILQSIIRDINNDLQEEHSVTSLLLGIVDNIKEPQQTVPEVVEEFASKW